MEVMSDYPSHRSLREGELGASLQYKSTDLKDCSDKTWHPGLFRVPSVNSQTSSFPSTLKRPCSEALSRTNSQVSLLAEGSVQELSDYPRVGGKEKAVLAATALTCRPSIRKFRQKGLTRSARQGLRGEKGCFSFGIPVQSFNKEEVAYHYGSPFSLDSPIQKSFSNVETANAAWGSPGTSITTEEHLHRSGSSSVQSFSDDELNHQFLSSSLKSTTSKEELFSAQSEILYSDGSVSSEVIGSPEIYSDLNQLMEFMLDDIDKVGCAKESFEAQFSVPVEIPFPCQDSLQHSAYGSHLGKPVGCFSPGETGQENTETLLCMNAPDELEVAISEGFHGLIEGQRGKSGLSAEIRSLQEAGLWERQKNTCNGLEEIMSHPKNLAQETGSVLKAFSAVICSRKYPGGPNIVSPYEKKWLHPPPHEDICGPEVGAQSSDVPSKGKYLQKHEFNYSLGNDMFGSPNLGSNNYQVEEIDKFCNSIGLQAPGLVSLQENIATHFGQIKEAGSKGGPYEIPLTVSQHVGIRSEADFNGIRLVHLLIAGAEAVATRDMDLASVILVRLKELVSRSGSTMQRVAAYFSDGLQGRIEGGRSVDRAGYSESYSDILAAFQILHEISPYIKFGHFTANQAILEAIEGEKRVHIVDFEVMEGIQWPSFMQALVSRKGGPPHLRITALCRSHVKRGLATVQETGKRLSEFAASLNLSFTFSQLRVDNEEEFRASALKLIKGEALVVNCMIHLPHMPHRTATSVSSFLRGMRKLSPVVLTLVEEELGCSTPAVTSYFFEALHHYSAIFDSLEACLSSETVARTLVERVFLAPRITSAVTFCGGSSTHSELGAEFARCNWYSLVSSAGFKSLPLSFHNLSQARLLLGLFKDGFKLDENRNRLLLGWRSKPLIAASAWN